MAEAQVNAACPESLEQIFLRIEEEVERRAQNDQLSVPTVADDASQTSATSRTSETTAIASERQQSHKNKARRRASISISRFGQIDSDSLDSPSKSSTPSNERIVSALASPIYRARAERGSTDTLESGHLSEDDAQHVVDDEHVTQVHRIAPRQSISRAIGNVLPRRLSRARSRPVLREGDMAGNMVIGISVQAATVEASGNEVDEPPLTSSVYATFAEADRSLQTKPSQSSLRSNVSPNSSGSGANSGWVARAKSFTNKLRRKSKQHLTDPVT